MVGPQAGSAAEFRGRTLGRQPATPRRASYAGETGIARRRQAAGRPRRYNYGIPSSTTPYRNSPVTEPFDIERPACFYLGREYDLATRTVRDDRPPVMYDSRDLLTHGVVVGMTGSGKTGLCVNLLEEAAIDGIPSIIIDPKGDLTNLVLQFPDLKPEDYLPWINPQDVRSKGLTPEAFAA